MSGSAAAEEDVGRFEMELFRRLRDDFAFYAPRALRFRPDEGGLKPLVLNDAQRILHGRIEDQRRRLGRVRVLVLKGRQQGISTYVQARFFWRCTHGTGLRAFILTHQDAATTNLYGMAERFYENCPAEIRPALGAANAKEFVFKGLDSGYRVGTAGNKGIGRSDTIQLFHGSEVALWPNAEEHVMGALQAVPDVRGTEIILESTSMGPTGMFYDQCMAAERRETDFELVFIPWWLERRYRRAVPSGFEATGEELAYMQAHGVDLEQIAWRRFKARSMRGLHNFRREYPATVEEAFRIDAVGALWRRSMLDECRAGHHPHLIRIVVAVDPSGGAGRTADEVGIIVAGLGEDGVVYVLEDASGRFTASEWAYRVLGRYQAHNADRIVVERNFGGDMVATNLRSVDRRAPVEEVVASRGKAVRAEPVSALYEQGRVKHIGMFPALEDELTTWVPGVTRKSPNRLDALVWAVFALVLGDSGYRYDTSMSWVLGGEAPPADAVARPQKFAW